MFVLAGSELSAVGSSTFSPIAGLGLNHGKYAGDKLETLAGNIFEHCNMALQQHDSAPYELPHYPIEEKQLKSAIERQMSQKWVFLTEWRNICINSYQAC